ncbi:MAG: LysM peptidoglycan-binding domain-containing protein [Treponema sp.]
MAQIGIKLANHDFFPIIDEDEKLPIEKELELTTVRDNQESVQINLFKNDGEFDPVYVGSLIIEDLSKMSSGDATILLKLKLDENKNLSAEAVDKDSGSKQSLSIPINDLGHFSAIDFDLDGFDTSSNVDDIDLSNIDTTLDGDFSFDLGEQDTNNIEENDAVSFDGDDSFEASDSSYSFDDSPIENNNIEEDYEDEDGLYEEDKKSGFPLWLKIFLIILILGLLALAVALFFKNKLKAPKEESTIELMQEQANIDEGTNATIEEIEEVAEPMNELTTEAPQKEAEPFPVKEETPPKVEDEVKKEVKEGVKIIKDDAIKKAVRYRVRWGDTLWDISGNFYKNPWAYRRIARYNKIKNPHKIIAGTYITIPAR